MPTLDHTQSTLVTGDCYLGILSQCCLFAYATFFHGMQSLSAPLTTYTLKLHTNPFLLTLFE